MGMMVIYNVVAAAGVCPAGAAAVLEETLGKIRSKAARISFWYPSSMTTARFKCCLAYALPGTARGGILTKAFVMFE